MRTSRSRTALLAAFLAACALAFAPADSALAEDKKGTGTGGSAKSPDDGRGDRDKGKDVQPNVPSPEARAEKLLKSRKKEDVKRGLRLSEPSAPTSHACA